MTFLAHVFEPIKFYLGVEIGLEVISGDGHWFGLSWFFLSDLWGDDWLGDSIPRAFVIVSCVDVIESSLSEFLHGSILVHAHLASFEYTRFNGLLG